MQFHLEIIRKRTIFIFHVHLKILNINTVACTRFYLYQHYSNKIKYWTLFQFILSIWDWSNVVPALFTALCIFRPPYDILDRCERSPCSLPGKKVSNNIPASTCHKPVQYYSIYIDKTHLHSNQTVEYYNTKLWYSCCGLADRLRNTSRIDK